MLYLFDDYALDTDRRELRRGGTLVPVEPRAFDLLAYVIENRQRVESRDDLIAHVWDGRIVSESALGTCINAARSAISDSGEAQRLIKTLPRKGIRLVGAVREGEKPEAAAAATAAERPKPGLALPDRPSIAVLPFANMSGDPEQDLPRVSPLPTASGYCDRAMPICSMTLPQRSISDLRNRCSSSSD